jgi:hypothetical protein
MSDLLILQQQLSEIIKTFNNHRSNNDNLSEYDHDNEDHDDLHHQPAEQLLNVARSCDLQYHRNILQDVLNVSAPVYLLFIILISIDY